MELARGSSWADNATPMEILGYSSLPADSAPEALVVKVERSLRSRPNKISGSAMYGRGDPDACEAFVKFGVLDCDFNRKIEETIGSPAWLLHQGPVIVHSFDRASEWVPHSAHPSRNGVSVFRALPSNMGHAPTTLKLYPISHHMSSAEFALEGGAIRSFHLRSNEVLFVRGALKMEISIAEGGYLVWQGFSAEPWALDPSSSETFSFMRI